MKTVCMDAGNTLRKVAFVENGVIRSVAAFQTADVCGLLRHIASMPQSDACIISDVGNSNTEIINALSRKAPRCMELTTETPTPVNNLYKTPETLGKDRLAAAVGAYSLFLGKDILVLDAGTALTIDFIDSAGNYRGGNISPGLNMRFRALRDYTQKLPLCSATDDFGVIGDSTASAIASGVQNGIIFEINAYINRFVKQYPKLVVILTGGDIIFFADKIEKPIFAESNLVIIGLNKIVEFNVKSK